MSSFRGPGLGGPDSLTVPLTPTPAHAHAPAHAPHGPAEVRLAGVENKEKMYEPKQRKKLVRVLTVVAYLFFVSLAAVMLSLYYVFLWNPSPREERQRQQQQQQRYQQKQEEQQQQQQQQQQFQQLQQQEVPQDDWSEDWSQGWSSTSLPDYVEATELHDAYAFPFSGQPSEDPAPAEVSAPASNMRRHHRPGPEDSNDIPLPQAATRRNLRHGTGT